MRTGTDARWQRLTLGKAAATPRHQVRAHPVFASALTQLTCTRACFGCAQSCLVAACGTRAAVQELKVCTCHNPSPFLRMTVDILCPRRVPTPLPCCCALVPTPPDPRRTHEAHTPMRARQADSRCKCVLPAILHAYVQKRRSQSVCTTIYEPWKGSRSSTKTPAATAFSRHFALENAFIE